MKFLILKVLRQEIDVETLLFELKVVTNSAEPPPHVLGLSMCITNSAEPPPHVLGLSMCITNSAEPPPHVLGLSMSMCITNSAEPLCVMCILLLSFN